VKNFYFHQVCEKAGVENGDIPTSDFISSSIWKNCNDKEKWRLNSAGPQSAWCAGQKDTLGNEYVGVKFSESTEISGLVTQGRKDSNQWVTKFKVGYTETDGGTVKFVKDFDGQDQIFEGNFDTDTPVENFFSCHLNVFSIAIYPSAIKSWTSLRFEVLKCA